MTRTPGAVGLASGGSSLYPMKWVQPRCEKLLRLGPHRWVIRVRRPDGSAGVLEIVGPTN
jgi:hypothetical protein